MARAPKSVTHTADTESPPDEQTESVGAEENASISSVTYVVERTAPAQLLRHDISDEELGILSDMRRDHIWEGMWASMALAVGAAPNAIAALWNCYGKEPSAPLEIVDLIQIIFFFVGVVLAVVLSFITQSRAKKATDLVTEIRARPPRHVL